MIKGQESLRLHSNATQESRADVAAHLLIGPQYPALVSGIFTSPNNAYINLNIIITELTLRDTEWYLNSGNTVV